METKYDVVHVTMVRHVSRMPLMNPAVIVSIFVLV